MNWDAPQKRCMSKKEMGTLCYVGVPYLRAYVTIVEFKRNKK